MSQRNLYDADSFKTVKKYGLNMLVPAEDDLQSYIDRITSQISSASS